jgi:hypothetical protein
MTDAETKYTEPWVPMAKDLAKLLPVNRSFTEIEAMYSLQLDHNNGNGVTVPGLAKRWGWTRKKVRCFLPRVGIKISYPEDTAKIQNQKGFITTLNEGPDQGPDKGQMSFIDFNKLKGTKGLTRARSGATTHEKERKEKKRKETDPKVRVFSTWFFEKYMHRFDREYQVTNWAKHGGQVKKLLKLPFSWQDLQYITIEFLLDDDPFMLGDNNRKGTGHNISMLLTRIGQNSYHKYLEADFREKNRGHIVDEEGKATEMHRKSQ